MTRHLPPAAVRGAEAAWPGAGLCIAVAVAALSLAGHSPGLDEAVIIALIDLIMVTGLSVFVGSSGVVSFGQVSFMAVGAYVCGMFTIPAIAKPIVISAAPAIFRDVTLGTTAGLLAGTAAATVLALVVSWPLMRLTGIGASIGTLALLLIVNTFFTNWQPGAIGGGNLIRIPTDTTVDNMVAWSVLAIAVAYLYQRSRFGLRVRAAREDEVAARALGVNVSRERRIAFTLSAAMFGLAGGLYGHTLGSFSAGDFYLQLTFLSLAMLVLGGTRSLAGAVTGTALLSGVSYVLNQWQNGNSALGITVAVPTGASDLMLAAVLIVVLIFRPDGLTRGQELPPPWTWLRRTRKTQLTASHSQDTADEPSEKQPPGSGRPPGAGAPAALPPGPAASGH